MKPYVEWIIRYRLIVIVLTLLVTVLAVYQAKNVKIVIDMNATLPQSHRYISTTNQIEQVFGSKYIVQIGLSPMQGDIYQPAIIEKVQRITKALAGANGIVAENLLSLSARRAKNIAGNDDGLVVKPLVDDSPSTLAQMDELRDAVAKNPVYLNSIVSPDGKSTAIIAEFKEPPDGFRSIMSQVEPIVAKERDASVDIKIGGGPGYLAGLEIYSERMVFLLPISIVVLSLVLFSAFGTWQGLILPLSTAGIAVAWGVGVMGTFGIPMDVFNATTPILILAVATGHAVQMLKRYYEEYYRLCEARVLSPAEANIRAIVTSVSLVAPVMIIAGTVACLGFFSLIVFEISTVRTFGIFTGIGILAALILELTFIPSLRAVLAPPRYAENSNVKKIQFWNLLADPIARWVTGPARRNVYVGFVCLIIFFAVGIRNIIVDNSIKSFFAPDVEIAQQDRSLNNHFGGTNTLYLLIEGVNEDAIKQPQTMQAMDNLQRFIETQPNVGKTVSIVDFIKRMNQAMHGDNKDYFSVPENQNLISQYLLLYSISGEPNDFNAYVDGSYRLANLTVFLKTDSSAYVEALIKKINAFSQANFNSNIHVRFGGSVTQSAALSEVMVHGKILNIMQIAAVVFFISSLIFRSVIAGFLVLLPLLTAVLINFGLMGWSGIALNVPTSLTSAMAVGIGADYVIYLIYRLREELRQGIDEITAVNNVIKTAGKAILFVALAVACGYGVLLLSLGFNVHKWLAILIASAMIVSALVSLLMVPALILTFKPGFIYTRETAKTNTGAAIAVVMLAVIAISGNSNTVWAAEVDVTKIMDANFLVTKVSNSVFDSTFKLIDKSGQERERKTFGATKLQDNGIDNMRMTRFLSPVDVKGTVSLLIEHSNQDDDIWIYLPALQKIRRLVSNNKKDSFVGTDLSYGDVIGYKVSEWNYSLIKEDNVDGQSVYIIESTPKSAVIGSNSGYSKRTDWIRKDNFVTVKSEYLDLQGRLLKSATYTDIKLVDEQHQKWQPMHIDVNNVQAEHRTIISIENFKVASQVNDEFFKTRYMEKEQ